MATQNPIIITHVYNEINKGKYRTVKHYEINDIKSGDAQFSNLINISKNRNCAQSMPEYWLKEHNGKKWNPFCTTGLFKTSKPNLFKGDKSKKKHLVIIKFSNNADTLTIYHFQNYYTTDLSNVWDFLVD